MYLTTTPQVIRWLMPSGLIWKIAGCNRALYLTFDDSPVAGVTTDTLAILESHKVRATFFCIGKNITKNYDLYKQITNAGHTIGNHTMSHLNGWKTSASTYIQDVEECGKYVRSGLFRPPYGRITRKQAKMLNPRFKIVMWSILSGDFDPDMNAIRCYDNVMKNIYPGAIIVMHDNARTAQKTAILLNRMLPAVHSAGYGFSKLDFDECQ